MKHRKIEFAQVIGACLLLGGLVLACASSLDEPALPTTTVPDNNSNGQPDSDSDSDSESDSERTESSQPAGIADRDIGLSKASVFDTPTPDPVKPNTTDPGEQALLPRPYEIAPPRIPHLVSDFLPITLSENLCVDCHQLDTAEEGDPTPIPASHFIDLRNAPELEQDAVAGARYVCLSCHVGQTEAQPLVQNLFGIATPAK